jgi:heterodisulfide reductase subunit A
MAEKKIGAVMVVGGGISGIQAALDLAESEFFVYLVEKKPAIGGVMPKLDKTFPTNDCSMCTLAPKLVEVDRHLNIEILAPAEVVSISGEAGAYNVEVLQRARYIDESRCIACGIYAEKCPKQVPNEFNQSLSLRKAAYVLYPQAIPLKYAIDKERCIYFLKGKCRACEKFCPSQAIDFSQTDQVRSLKIGSVLLADPRGVNIERFSYKNNPRWASQAMAKVLAWSNKKKHQAALKHQELEGKTGG